MTEVIGTATDAHEDDFGLWSHFDLSSVQSAQDVRIKVLEGHIDGFSIGYKVIRAIPTEFMGRRITDLLELSWYETTVTVLPVNELAMITAAKSLIGSAPDTPEGRAHAEKIEEALQSLDLLVREGPQTLEGKSSPSRLLQQIAIERRKLELLMVQEEEVT